MVAAIDKRPPLVISYLRFSKAEQGKGNSTRRQLERSEEWAKARGLTIDDRFDDKGVSAFRGRNASHGALGRLLDLIEQGRIPKGSVLLVESLDRLSRQTPRQALNQFLRIIEAGVTIVTIGDDARAYSADSCDMTALLVSLVIMSRAHEESSTKSRRGRDNWDRKRQRAAEGKGVLTKMLPAWLRLSGDGKKIVPDPEAAATVKQMFRLVLQGYGLGTITRKFNREGVKAIGRTGVWSSWYVYKTLTNRAVLGELEMRRTGDDGKRVNVGVVKDYYPRVIDDRTFDAVGALLKQRSASGGRGGGYSKKHPNLFNGIMVDERGESYTIYERVRKGMKNPYRLLVSMGALTGKQTAPQINLRLSIFESAFFDAMVYHFSNEVVPATADTRAETELDALLHRVAETDAKMATIQEQMLGHGAKVDGVVVLLGRLEQQRRELEERVAQVRSLAVFGDADRLRRTLKTFVGLVKGNMDADARVELQAVIRSLVKRIELRLTREGKIVRAAATVHPHVGKTCRFAVSYNPFVLDRQGSTDPRNRVRWFVEGRDEELYTDDEATVSAKAWVLPIGGGPASRK